MHATYNNIEFAEAKDLVELIQESCPNGKIRLTTIKATLSPEEYGGIISSPLSQLESILMSCPISDSFDSVNLNECNPFKIIGDLASIIYFGCAYGPDHKSDSMLILGKIHSFLSRLSLEDWHTSRCYYSYDRWSDWFLDGMWDFTYLLTSDKLEYSVLICVTDTD